MTFRGMLMWVHLGLGLTAAVILAVIAGTGVYITFQDPLTRLINPVPAIARSGGVTDLDGIVTTVESRFAPQRVATVELPEGQAAIVRLRDRTTVYVHPVSATVLFSRPARFASLENLTALMRRTHTELVLGPKGRILVTFATGEALLLALSGPWLWWRKKHWQFRRWEGSLFRVSWDLHNATGIWFVAPVLTMVLTGLLLAMPQPVYRVAGAEPAPWSDAPRSSEQPSKTAPVSLARVLAVADSARPGEPTMRLVIPSDPAGAYAVGKTRETVYVDQYRAAVITVQPERAPTAGDDAILAVEELHTGEWYGIAGRAVMTLGSLMLGVMTVTGAILGIKRLMILAGARSRALERS